VYRGKKGGFLFETPVSFKDQSLQHPAPRKGLQQRHEGDMSVVVPEFGTCEGCIVSERPGSTVL